MSSKRRLRRKSCTGKSKHPSMEVAYAALRSLLKVNPGTPFMTPYKCQFCGGYHIGHAKGTGPRPN